MGLDSLEKFAKEIKVEKKQPEQQNKKVNWSKVILLIWKILEPEMQKLPKIYSVIPISIIWFLGYGFYKTILLIIVLFQSY